MEAGGGGGAGRVGEKRELRRQRQLITERARVGRPVQDQVRAPAPVAIDELAVILSAVLPKHASLRHGRHAVCERALCGCRVQEDLHTARVWHRQTWP
jgi:hypothetical protein